MDRSKDFEEGKWEYRYFELRRIVEDFIIDNRHLADGDALQPLKDALKTRWG